MTDTTITTTTDTAMLSPTLTPRAHLLQWLAAQDTPESPFTAAINSADLVRGRGTTHELVTDLLVMQRVLEVTEGELPEELEPAFDAITKALASKVDNVCDFLDNIEIRANALKAEIDRLTARKKALDGEYKRLEAYFLMQLQRSGETKWEGEHGRALSLRKSAPKLEVVAPALVPAAYQNTETVVTTDARKLLADAKAAGGELYKLDHMDITVRDGHQLLVYRPDGSDVVTVCEVPDTVTALTEDDVNAVRDAEGEDAPWFSQYRAQNFVDVQRNPDTPAQWLLTTRTLYARTVVTQSLQVR